MIPNPAPLKSGYSRKVLDENIALRVREGFILPEARSQAIRHARRVYFARHPDGALPLYLSHAGKRLRMHFYPDGREKPDAPRTTMERDYRLFPETDAELYAQRPSRHRTDYPKP